MYSNTLLMRLMYSGFMDDVFVRVVPKLAGVVEFPKGCVSGWLCPARERCVEVCDVVRLGDSKRIYP